MRFKLAIVLLFCLVSISFADEPWYQTYEAAKKAVASQQWSVAETKLNECLKKNPTQGRRVSTYGMIWTVYIPDYYLGIVYYNQGKFDQALQQFKKVQSAGLVTAAHPEYAAMMKLRQSAMEKIAASQPKTEQQNVQHATASQPQLAQQPNQTIAPATPQQAPADRGSAALKQAQQMLEWRQFEQAKRRAQDALAQGADRNAVSAVLTKIEVQTKLQDLRAAVGRSEWPEAQNISREVLNMDSSNTEAQQLQKTIDQALAKTTSDELIAHAILAFYSGQYEQTIDLLQRTIPKSESAEVHFYLGCSYAAEGFLNLAERENLLRQAKQEFAKVRQLDPAFNTRDRSISPRILTLYLQSI